MLTINITNARKDLYHLIDHVNRFSEPVFIVGKRGNAVLLSENDWNAIQETLYLNSIDGMAESIVNGANTPINECIPADIVKKIVEYHV